MLIKARTHALADEPPTGPATSPGFQMWLVTLAWQRAIRVVLRPFELTHVQFVLLAGVWWLSSRDGDPTQMQLAEHTSTDPMMTSQVLRRLEEKQLIERLTDVVDTRAKRVRLTRSGERLLLRAMPAVDAGDAAFFAPVSRPQLLEMLMSLAPNEEKR